MVVCKYFLQGTCKFGTYCHYEHQAPSNYTSFSDKTHQSTSVLRQSNFGSVQPQNTKAAGSTGNVDVNTLVKSVINDMTGAEKGGQWILSCYAPFKEKPAFPGFEDQSPEEIRLGFYEAQKNGSTEQYKAQLQAILQHSMIKIQALQNPSQDVVTILQNIYATLPSSNSGTYGQNVLTPSSGGLNHQNTFSAQNQGQSPFSQGNTNIFKTNNQQNSTNIFASGSSQNNFSGWQQNQGQTNIFGNGSSSPTSNQNIFSGSTLTQNTIFASQPGSNIFSNSGQTSHNSGNIFGPQALSPSSQPSIFAQSNQQPTNIFQSPISTNQSQNVFASPNMAQQSVFVPQSNQMSQHNIFTTQNQPHNIPTQTGFSPQNQQQQQNIFQSSPSNYSSSIFGYSTNSNPAIAFGSTAQQPVDESLYSKLEELSDEEKNWFESDTFDILNIPDKPPSYDMCFKV